jgi:hypothetical protein
MPYGITQLSTPAVPGNSSALSVNWRGWKPFRVAVTTSSSVATGDFTIQYALADLNSSAIQTSSGSLPGPSWLNLTAAEFGISSAVTSSAGYQGLHFTSSTIFPDGVGWRTDAPVAGVRINSTALSSNTLTMALLQGEGF